ncbi:MULTISPECIES: 5-formyltetrahydrofolate cyclo-ligase [Aerococcus]|uniref:5-formyltetrahydrofolate cyclo-ligase n=2 Tax=Aerococcus TaxID=1375 RepID=A0A178HFU7_9LACT|nr:MULTISPECIES: 5-formyltetrahydrofolate cyclo-ligase [Aerococcus]KAA9221201.1 5-formyltetrahydrofolate cyclo-ligase [Aerococcus loyolae]KAA9264016.1 5-formyltetrahydrofolate cyclo-ligase [Aerococcus loyolae]MCY3025505.1 5-formyltetrahydrofolate cyclo-ligase [Aerococcus loyolae]MCY3026549.1 5-formyltetrahydrofolate cyclo-ligase [Aerococcus loyolae]MCY3028343.1 5-formyltetrahydrofolate cyclo-ligase [Aerococcus loyolae]
MTDEIDKAKASLRQKIKSKRQTLPQSYYQWANEIISHKLVNFSIFNQAKRILLFSSLPYEFNTQELINFCFKQEIQVLLPRVEGKSLGLHYVNESSTYQKSKYDILEPQANSPQAGISMLDLIILPCLSCNRHGQRLGYGGGYYDRLLVDFKGITIIPYFDKLMTSDIPCNDYDIKADYIISESGIFSTNESSDRPFLE